MKLHRFIYHFDASDKQLQITDHEVVRQMLKVLRLNVGDQVVLCDGNLNEVTAKIEEVSKKVIKLQVIKVQENSNEPARNVALYCSVLKRENFELVVQKATEVGVSQIIPVITKRTVKLQLKQDRLEKIIKEAAEQSGRGVVPKLLQPQQFEAIANSDQAIGKNIIFDVSGRLLVPSAYSLGPVGIWIGPEGGWDPQEIDVAKKAGFQIASLGKLTLRAETAAVVATYLAANW